MNCCRRRPINRNTSMALPKRSLPPRFPAGVFAPFIGRPRASGNNHRRLRRPIDSNRTPIRARCLFSSLRPIALPEYGLQRHLCARQSATARAVTARASPPPRHPAKRKPETPGEGDAGFLSRRSLLFAHGPHSCAHPPSPDHQEKPRIFQNLRKAGQPEATMSRPSGPRPSGTGEPDFGPFFTGARESVSFPCAGHTTAPRERWPAMTEGAFS